jgi:hypothetical protein
MTVDIETRFWGKVDASGDCWEWQAQRSNGYGRVRRDGRWVMAHRLAYELLVGPIPDGLCIDHLCRNRGCVNPTHMEAVPDRVNILRGQGFAARAARQTTCPSGHEYDAVGYRGARTCTLCHLAAGARYRARLRALGHGSVAQAERKTTCPSGHEYNGVTAQGWRTCSICVAARQARYRTRQRALAGQS